MPRDVEIAWERLWQDHLAAEKLQSSDVVDAELICSLGWELARQRGDWPTAIQRLERWFEHPQSRDADYITRVEFRSRIGLGRLLVGNISEAISIFNTLLDERPVKGGRFVLNLIRNHLHDYCEWQPADQIASPNLAQLSADVVARYPGRKRIARPLDPGAPTFGQLASVLRTTFGR